MLRVIAVFFYEATFQIPLVRLSASESTQYAFGCQEYLLFEMHIFKTLLFGGFDVWSQERTGVRVFRFLKALTGHTPRPLDHA
jgi:hypothetical protein